MGHAVQGHPHRNPRVAARTPAARVGLHQTLANSRETTHTIPKCIGTRALGSRWTQTHTAAAHPETQGHALPRAPSLLLSPRHLARRKPAAPSVAPRPSPRASRRGSSNDLPRNGPRKLTGARTLQACNKVRFRGEQPPNSESLCSASPHALLHVWSPKWRPRKKKQSPPCAAGCAHVRTRERCVCVCVCVLCGVPCVHRKHHTTRPSTGSHADPASGTHIAQRHTVIVYLFTASTSTDSGKPA